MWLKTHNDMKQNYQFTITGMTCHACESLITMDLEDAGLQLKSISHDPGILMIELDESAVDHVKTIIQSSQKYTVTSVQVVS